MDSSNHLPLTTPTHNPHSHPLDCLREGEEIPNPYSFSLSHTSKTTKSSDIVPDLQNTMYAFIDGYPCVRLMNLSGTISCSSESPRSLILSLSSINLRVLRINCKKFFDPGRDKVVAPIVRFENVDIIAEPSAVLDVPNSPDPFMNLATAQIKATLVEKYRRSTYATRAKNRIQELSIDEGLQPPTQHGSQASWWKQLFNTDKEIICEHV
ncbi:ABC transporter G family member 15 [Glycine soja]